MTIKVELASAGFDGQVEHLEALQNQLVEKLKAEIWVRPNVDLLPAGTLPVAEGKAKRVVDKRSLWPSNRAAINPTILSMSPVNLVAVFMENKPGQTARITKMLAEAGVNIRWVTIANSGSFGVIKFLVDQPDEAVGASRRRG